MRRSSRPPRVELSKYGLPKNYVVSDPCPGMSAAEVVWLRLVDSIDAAQLDALDALKTRRISDRQYERELSRLKIARWRAQGRRDRARKGRR